MSYAYYQQFTDDEDLFPVYELDEVDTDFCHDKDETEIEELDCFKCSDRGCNYCLGVDW